MPATLSSANAVGPDQPADAEPPDQQWPSWASPSATQQPETARAERLPDRRRPPLPWDIERPAADSIAELRLRLERLPDGHPSSPYADDGRLKLPVMRLKDLELPLSADSRPAAGAEPAGSRAAGPGGWGSVPAHSPAGTAGRLQADPIRPDALTALGSNGSAADSPGSRRAAAAGSAGSRFPADPYALPPRDLGAPDSNGSNGSAGRRASARPGGSISSVAEAPDLLPGNGTGVADEPRSGEPETQETAEARTNPDGSWEWKGRHLTAEQNEIAVQALDKCRAAEGRNVFGSYREAGLTPAMRRIESQLDNCYLVPETDRFALKSADRFKEKLAKLISRFPGEDAASLVPRIRDAIRYTFIFDEAHYVNGVREADQHLKNAGYELLELRNMWRPGEYKGVNSQWREPTSGCRFEVQWHTPTSWAAKQRNHAAYERAGDPNAPVDEVERLRSDQRDISDKVVPPPGIAEIKSYKSEG